MRKKIGITANISLVLDFFKNVIPKKKKEKKLVKKYWAKIYAFTIISKKRYVNIISTCK